MPILDRLTSVPEVADPTGFAHAVVASGKLAFTSGQVALDAQGNLVGTGDLATQTAQCLRNLHQIIRSMGADWRDVIRFNWYVVDASAVQVIRDVRDEFIRPALGELSNPASSLIQVAALFRPDVLIEVDAVVALPD